MDGGTSPPHDAAAADDEVDIRLPDDPRVPQPEDADPRVSKELGGAAPAIGPGRSGGEPPIGTHDAEGGTRDRSEHP